MWNHWCRGTQVKNHCLRDWKYTLRAHILTRGLERAMDHPHHNFFPKNFISAPLHFYSSFTQLVFHLFFLFCIFSNSSFLPVINLLKLLHCTYCIIWTLQNFVRLNPSCSINDLYNKKIILLNKFLWFENNFARNTWRSLLKLLIGLVNLSKYRIGQWSPRSCMNHGVC